MGARKLSFSSWQERNKPSSLKEDMCLAGETKAQCSRLLWMFSDRCTVQVVYQIVPGEEERRSVLGKRCRRFLTVTNIEDLWIPQWRCQWILILIFYRL